MSNIFVWCQRLKKKQEHRDSAAEIVDSEQSFDNGMKFGQLSMSMMSMMLHASEAEVLMKNSHECVEVQISVMMVPCIGI